MEALWQPAGYMRNVVESVKVTGRAEERAMKHRSFIVAAAAACSACASALPPRAKTITLPPDGVQLKPSPLPGYAKAQANCIMCHSAEYMRYQPPNAGAPVLGRDGASA